MNVDKILNVDSGDNSIPTYLVDQWQLAVGCMSAVPVISHMISRNSHG